MNGLPLSLVDVHHQLRQHPGMLDSFANAYGVEPSILLAIAAEPAERIEVFERDRVRDVGEGWRRADIASKLSIYGAMVMKEED